VIILQKQGCSGKERDTETGLDYFGARYMSSAQGRFASPDPSPGGIAVQNPQSWNLYSYVRNRPTRFVDENGLWPTELHKTIIDVALSGYLSSGELARLTARQEVMDYGPSSQSPKFSHQHFMRSARQTATQGAHEAWSFVTTQGLPATGKLGAGGALSLAALDDLGDAMHTVQDFTSPAHANSNGEPYIWRGPLGENVRYIGHYIGEEGPQKDWARFGQAIRLTMALLIQYAPRAARERGLTATNLDAEAAKRISAYVTSFFSTMPGSMFGPSQAMQEDAARQCALGNPAACNR